MVTLCPDIGGIISENLVVFVSTHLLALPSGSENMIITSKGHSLFRFPVSNEIAEIIAGFGAVTL